MSKFFLDVTQVLQRDTNMGSVKQYVARERDSIKLLSMGVNIN